MKHFNLFFIFLLISSTLFAQNVGIGTTTPAEKLHIQGNLRVEGRTIYFGALQSLYGNNASALYFNSNSSDYTQIVLRDAEAEKYGHLYGSSNGTNFGLLDGDGHWGYLQAKDNYTQFRINNEGKMIIRANGHVGIGTGSPGGKLTVVVDTLAAGLQVLSAHGNSHVPYSNGWSYLAGKGIIFRTTSANTEQVRITPGGYTGFGVTSPTQRIHTAGNLRVDGRTVFLGANQSLYGNNASALYFDSNSSDYTQVILRDAEDEKYGHVYGSGNGVNFGLLDGDGHWGYLQAKDNYTQFRINNEGKMIIRANGNVGIGITVPTDKLAVNGNIRSKEVLVETANWPDYVFDDDYELPTLEEEEDFIQENGHLFGFESEEEMEGTLTVGDVTKRQQEKIEQLMLHLIEMRKVVKTMENGMEVMENNMEIMGAGMEKMESEISTLKSENQTLKEELGKE